MFKYLSFLMLAIGLVFSPIGHAAESLPIDQPIKMPLVGKPVKLYGTAKPIEQRGPEFATWLSVSVKISVRGASGSGTIIYYDDASNTAYVASCGHLWSGAMSAEQGKQQNRTCKVIIWYHNEDKLAEPKTYPANVIFYNNGNSGDTSLLTFQPDWKPNYFPIAPVDYNIQQGTRLHSIGSDGGREAAHYDVRFTGYEGKNLVTEENSPRPGRSGGGLLSDDGYYVGTCWGTSTYSGEGEGYFTRLSNIHRLWDQNGYGFLLKIESPAFAQSIPIIDKNNPQGKYPRDYILMPKR